MRPLIRLWFRVLSTVRPVAAERQAADLFMTPRRRPLREPELPGVPRRDLTADVGGAVLKGWSWGDGPVVLLVHGWSGRAADLTDIASALVASGYQAVAYDMPAHGSSGGRRTSLADWMRVLPALAERHSGAHAVVAHSLGAAGATLALEQGMRARGAVLLAPPLGPEFFLARIQRFIGLPAARSHGMIRHLEYLVGHELAFFNSARAAASLSVPALIVHDPADDEVPFAHGEAVARAWSGSELVAVEQLGHYRILRSPDVVARVVDFVSRLGETASGHAGATAQARAG